MHPCRFREADRLASEPFDSSSQRQMLALDFLRITFARGVLFWFEMTGVGTPLVSVVMGLGLNLTNRSLGMGDVLVPSSIRHALRVMIYSNRPDNTPVSCHHMSHQCVWL